jgi:hypothetical protein
VSLLDRQMLFVTGKGGVGKSTVAAALGLAAARAGRRTIVCELAGQARVPALLGVDPGIPGEETRMADGLCHLTIVYYRTIEEWISKMLGSRALTGLLTRSNFFHTFAEAAPGAAELAALVKSWELAQDVRWDRRRRPFDLVIVDGPATGHAVAMLRTPATYAEIARVGPIAHQSDRVREWLADVGRTAYLAVALPGELPVSETIDLGRRMRRALGRGLERIIVNGVLPDRFADGDVGAVERASGGSFVAEAVRAADRRADAQHEQVVRLDAGADAPITELPFVFAPQMDRAHVEELADRLSGAV